MAHEITSADAMISGRFITPWHGIGEVTGEFGIDDLHRIMGWHVEKVKLQTVTTQIPHPLGQIEQPSIITDKYATVRLPRKQDEQAIVLGAGLSEGYRVLQNTDLIKVVEPFVNNGCKLETAGTLRQGARVWVMLRLSSEFDVKGSDDYINPYIMVSNDHTGSQAAKIGLVAVRVVCQNTLNAAESDTRSKIIRILHQGDVTKNLQTVANMLDHVNGKFINYAQDLNKLAGVGINEADLRKYVRDCLFDRAEQSNPDKAMRILKTEEKVIELFETGAGSDLKSANGTVYGAYQAVNHYLNHNRNIPLETRLSSMVWGTRSVVDRGAFREALKLAA